ncbi:hypothetical protein VTH06DRAFT_6670 [Thermothelomyces fergusii]
MSLSIT